MYWKINHAGTVQMLASRLSIVTVQQYGQLLWKPEGGNIYGKLGKLLACHYCSFYVKSEATQQNIA